MAAWEILSQGELLLSQLPPEVYSERVPAAFDASIGGHYRHCLDHFTSWLAGFDTGEIDYDRRERDRQLEADPQLAAEVTRRLRRSVAQLDPTTLEGPTLARCEVGYEGGASPATASSFGRELVYTIAHAIHHFALISVMARLLGVRLPSGFGVAPSTLSHLRTLSRGERKDSPLPPHPILET